MVKGNVDTEKTKTLQHRELKKKYFKEICLN